MRGVQRERERGMARGFIAMRGAGIARRLTPAIMARLEGAVDGPLLGAFKRGVKAHSMPSRYGGSVGKKV